MMRIMEGPQAGKLLPFELEQADDHWVLTLQGRQRVYLRQDPQGGLAIFREDDLTEQVQVEYDPALPMLPARVTVGSVNEGQARMVVRHLVSGAPRDQGTCHYRVQILKATQVDVPAGTYPAYIVYAVRDIRLALAQATVVIETAYAPGVGQVAEIVHQQTRALGLVGGTSIQRVELAP